MLIMLLLGAFTFGCSEEEILSPLEQLEQDEETIDQFLADNSITAQTDPSGLRYVITTEGQGDQPSISDNVRVSYEGRFLSNGNVFDASPDIQFPLSGVILGWQIGLQLMREGGAATLYLPSGLAYGRGGTTGIPPNSILIFDVTLKEIN